MVDKLDIRNIRKMSDKEISDAIEDNRSEMWQLRLDKATGELKDENLFSVAKRNLARLKTVQHERLLAAQMQEKGSKSNG